MYQNILHATDLSENHFAMCQQAVEIAKRFQAKLYLLHVIEAPVSLQLAQGLGFAELYPPTQMLEDAKTVMAALGEAFNLPLDQQRVEIGSIKTQVLETIQALNCQLIILGRHRPSSLPLFLGSTAHTVVQQAPCDVLTLRSEA